MMWFLAHGSPSSGKFLLFFSLDYFKSGFLALVDLEVSNCCMPRPGHNQIKWDMERMGLGNERDRVCERDRKSKRETETERKKQREREGACWVLEYLGSWGEGGWTQQQLHQAPLTAFETSHS